MSEPAGVADFPSANHPSDAAPIIRVLKICNKKGLHARASAKFVQTVEKFDAEVKAAVVDALAALVSGRFTEEE